MNIPKTIFQTWKDRTNIPENFSYWSNSFKEANPSYLYRLWDDKDNRAFISKEFPWFLEKYDSYPAEIYRADAVRYFFLYKFGGIYADMDTECLRPLDDLLPLADVIFGRMGNNPASPHSIPNAIMLSKPRQEFWLLVMSLLMTAPEGQRPEFTTGPAITHRAVNLYLNQYKDDEVQRRIAEMRLMMGVAMTEMSTVRFVENDVFYPVNWMDQIHDRCFRQPLIRGKQPVRREDVLSMFPSSFMVTFWWHSWNLEEQLPENEAKTAC